MSINYKNYFYNQYKHNIYSQNGEDGVLNELLHRLQITKGYVCEFGSWDGKYLSNTFNLVTQGFKAVYIESDIEKYKDLLKTVCEYPTITPINSYVSHEQNDNCLDKILEYTDIPNDFDVLSIDIDSYDYQVWKSLKNYRPKIVVIEINSHILPNVTNHIHTPNKYQGTSFLPMYKLGLQKGYTFVLHTGNMIFVRSDLYKKLNLHYDDPLENFRRDFLPDRTINLYSNETEYPVLSTSFFNQKLACKQRENRLLLFSEFCRCKDAIHIGCADWPVFNPDNNLHIQLTHINPNIDGLDKDIESINNMKSLPQLKNCVFYTDIPKKEYDTILIPETIEHVDNPAEFLQSLLPMIKNDSVIVITAPNAFCDTWIKEVNISDGWCHELVHPDHKCWYSPYTLTNTIKNAYKEHGRVCIKEIGVLDNKTMVYVVFSLHR